jgi:hypothetical protein
MLSNDYDQNADECAREKKTFHCMSLKCINDLLLTFCSYYISLQLRVSQSDGLGVPVHLEFISRFE